MIYVYTWYIGTGQTPKIKEKQKMMTFSRKDTLQEGSDKQQLTSHQDRNNRLELNLQTKEKKFRIVMSKKKITFKNKDKIYFEILF